ncbi:hypothetical protein P691DRAFT_769207 [Macrolepiota fuliginosa MF-IS2]|uniref:Uncharacterized protein n=1 Tax=Macrolepiota fuliginosa MF-IS2 TaxID=1400762 RepID=A0A9P6BUD0_9AGAR|nr:hypothetical protein P691DRAFT_769207 [Macrolepiota fuliginosa MF-IS2]
MPPSTNVLVHADLASLWYQVRSSSGSGLGWELPTDTQALPSYLGPDGHLYSKLLISEH